jgi:hypothetical protein
MHGQQNIKSWCKFPEEGECAETSRSKLIVKYTIYKIVHFLVPKESVIQFTMHGLSNMKEEVV